MIPVSSEFLLQMWTDRSFHYSVVITFADNRTVTLTEDDLLPVGCHITTSAGVNSFPLGNAFCKVLELQFFNLDGRFADYDFYMARVAVTLSYVLSETTEPLNLGTYTVTEPETYGTIITLKAYDRMYKADKPFTGSITFPTTAGLLFAEACYDAGLSPLRTDFNNNNFVINSLPENITNRQIIAGCAQIAGGNALIKNLAVAVAAYNPDDLAPITTYYGGIFDDATPYATGDSVSGGSFVPWDDPVADGGTFEDFRFQQIFTEVIRQTTCTDDVIITGIQTKTEDGTEVMSGNTGYVLSITNPLITGREQAAVNAIGTVLNGMRFRPFELETMAYPLAEFGDIVYIMNGDRLLTTLVTDIEFNLKGVTKLKCSADAPLRNSSKNYVGDISSSTLQAARQQTAGQISRYNTEITRLTELIQNSFGMFQTEETLSSGGKIYYSHDKPELRNSQKIWMRTAEAFLVSSDGGRTWNAGIDADGHAVVNVLSAVGINADWINAGHISADKIQGGHVLADVIRGGTLILNGNSGSYGKLEIRNSSGTPIITNDNTGLKIVSGGTINCNQKVDSDWVNVYGEAFCEAHDAEFDEGGSDIISYADPDVYRYAKISDGTFEAGHALEAQLKYPVTVGRLQTRLADEKMGVFDEAINRIDMAFNRSGRNYLTLGAFTGNNSDAYIFLQNVSTTEALHSEIDAYQPYWGVAYDSEVYEGLDISGGYQVVSETYVTPYIVLLKTAGVKNHFYIEKNLYVGGTKHRVVGTENYASRLQYCYETATPYFGDIGSGQTDENGECYVFFDDIFRETIAGNTEYVVFLQKEGPGDLWVSEKAADYFVVKGAPDTPFSWELKAKQKNFADERLEELPQEQEYEETIPEDDYTEPDYEAEGAQLIEDYINEQEDIPI